MPSHPVLEGKKRGLLERPRRTTMQVLAGLLILAVPTYALATSGAPVNTQQPAPGVAPAAPVAAPQQAPQPAPAPANVPMATPQGVPVADRGLAEAFSAAIALQGDIVMRDWTAATTRLEELKNIRLAAPTARAERARLAIVTPLIDGLEATIKARNVRSANEQAYRLAGTLLAALDTRAPLGGGGGGLAPVTAASHPVAAVEHIRRASEEAARAQLGLLANDAKGAKAHLDQVREELKGATAATSSRSLKASIADLDKRRWRVVAALNNPTLAYHNGTLLSRGLMRTMHLVGRRSALMPAAPQAPGAVQPGGGGGGVPRPVLQDVPQPTHAGAPHARRDKQVALETTPYAKHDVR